MTRLQLNIRLTQEQHDVLQAAAFVRDLRSPQDVITPMLTDLVADLLTNENVVKARDALTGERGRAGSHANTDEVVSIRPRSKRS